MSNNSIAVLIPLTGKRGAGKFAIIDAEDHERVSKTTWHMNEQGYALGRPSRRGNDAKTRLHRFILGVDDERLVDHINRDRLDNRKSNLRICTRSENEANSTVRKNKTGYKGVVKQSNCNKYMARIKVNYKGIYLGSFETPEEAARAYDAAAVKHFGEFALTNF